MDGPSDSSPPSRSAVGWALMAGSIALVSGLLALLVYRVAQGNPGRSLVESIKAGKRPVAPDFRHAVIWPRRENWPASLWALVDRGSVSRRDLLGHPVVINFWASWCIPCAREAPRLNASSQEHRGRVAFLGIDVKDFTPDARAFLRKHDVDYVSVHARGDSTYLGYGLTGVPETYYLDAGGRIVGHDVGEVSRQEIEAGLAKAAGS